MICSLFENTPDALNNEQKKEIRDLFSIGGYSFNSIKQSKEESRRVELKIEFWSLEDNKNSPNTTTNENNFGACAI